MAWHGMAWQARGKWSGVEPLLFTTKNRIGFEREVLSDYRSEPQYIPARVMSASSYRNTLSRQTDREIHKEIEGETRLERVYKTPPGTQQAAFLTMYEITKKRQGPRTPPGSLYFPSLHLGAMKT